MLFLLFSVYAISFTSLADDELPSTKIKLSSVSVQQSSSVNYYVYIDNASNLSALSFDIYYPQDVMDISYAYTHSILQHANTSMNYDQEGVFHFSMTSLDGIQGNDFLVSILIHIKDDANIGEYPMMIAVGEAYDVNLSPVSIDGIHGKVTITEKNQSINSIQLYYHMSNTNVYQYDTFSIEIYSWQLYKMAAGVFEFFYDYNEVMIKSVQVLGQMNHQQALYTINTSIPGYVNISYASLYGLDYSQPMIRVTFDAIQNVEKTSQVMFKTKNLYDENLRSLLGHEMFFQFQLKHKQDALDYPDMHVTSYSGGMTDRFTIDVRIDAGSNLAAGDFSVTYDKQYLTAVDIKVNSDLSRLGGFLTYNEDISNGLIRFSYINANGLIQSETFLSITFEPKSLTNAYSGVISVTGSGVVNDEFQPILFEYKSGSILLAKTYRITFQDDDGTILSIFQLKEGSLIEAPVPPLKVGYRFVRWNQSFDVANQDVVIKAIYEIDHSTQFVSKTVTYDGSTHTIEAINLPEGSTILYSPEPSFIYPGTYPIIATISKEGHEDLVLEATLTIQRAKLTITADNLSTFFGQPVIPLTYTVQGNIYNNEVIITILKEEGIEAGTYPITVMASHPYYDITLIPGTYQITGQTIDMSGVSFDSISHAYDGTEKILTITGSLPIGVLGVEYSNNTLTHVGSTQAVVRFLVESGYDPVGNRIATLTIEKAPILGIILAGGSYVYDGTPRSFTLSGNTTQFGDHLNVEYSLSNMFTNAGTYTMSVTLSHQNYHTLVLTETLEIKKAARVIDTNDFTFDIRSESIDIQHPTLQANIYYSIDGINYIKSSSINGLSENTVYQITIYIGETENHLPSNLVGVEYRTYTSSARLMQSMNAHQNILLSTRSTIIEVMNDLEGVRPDEKAQVETQLQELIARYNQYVTVVNQEYQVTESYAKRVLPLMLSLSSALGFVWILFRRKPR